MQPRHDCGVCGLPMRCVSRSRYGDGTTTYRYACEHCKVEKHAGGTAIVIPNNGFPIRDEVIP